MSTFDANGGTMPLRKGSDQGVELRVDGISVLVDHGPDEGKAAGLTSATLSIGTDPGNDLRLTDPTVSRRHVIMRVTPDGVLAEDLGTTNGTWLAGVRVKAAIVPDGGTLTIGRTRLVVRPAVNRLVVQPSRESSFHGLIGSSRAMREIYALVRQLAGTDLPVTITGETGTGKELVSRALHLAGPRKDRPFLVLDCGSVTPDLLRSELFGHEKGSFTGAERTVKGLLEEASGGTVFLDEIGEMDLAIQPQLLRALETRQVTRIGSRSTIDVEFRVVSASNRDLRQRSIDGLFRSDLLYRLSAVTIRLPPLRARMDDLPLLIRHLVQEYSARNRTALSVFTKEAMEALSGHEWPGNVRELKNTVDTLCALSGGRPVDQDQVTHILAQQAQAGSGIQTAPIEDPGPATTDAPGAPSRVAASGSLSTLEELECAAIAKALEATGWNRRAAARRLGIAPSTLLRKIEAYALRPTTGQHRTQ